MEVKEFLQLVVTAESGFFNLSVRPTGESNWWEEWYIWPNDLDKIVERAIALRDSHNVYFSSYLFCSQSSTKVNVLPSRTIQADLDNADLSTISIIPTVIVESSPGRYQAYWILKSELDPEQHEILSRKITYSIPLCDHGGWPLGRKVRLPDTFNHKYLEGPQPVKVYQISGKKYDVSTIELLPDINAESAKLEEEWLDKLPTKYSVGPYELLESIKPNIPPRIYIQYGVAAKDRSRALWALMCAAFRAGLGKDQVYWLAKHSENNKFSGLRYNGDRELGKDILRAEQITKSKVIDIRQAVLEARKLTQSTLTEKKQLIFELVLAHLKSMGTFIRTTDDSIWYIRKDLGRPISISPKSEYLAMILDLQFGLNATEIEQGYVIHSLSAYARNMTASASLGSLSYYDPTSNSILIHTGKGTIYRITETNIEKATNGSFGVVFPWIVSSDEFEPKLDTNIDWSQILFENVFNNVIGITPDEALAVAKVWFMFLLFRNASISRPILALFGQPGSGKSTLARRMYRVIYGSNRGLGTVTTQDDYDYASSADPLLILDNVDTWTNWLPDRLAQSASTSDIVKRKLYTDTDVITLKRQALVGLTAHNPKFGREDVADRLILLNFQRLEHFEPEQAILEKISINRPYIWGSIINDTQKILNTTIEINESYPQFRIEDFARTGWRIAKALNVQNEFAQGLQKISIGQKLFTLDEESLLVATLQRMCAKKNRPTGFISSHTLWTELESVTTDPNSFQKTYRNAVALGKKLWAMQESLKAMFDIQWKFNSTIGARTWYITTKGDSNGRES